MPNPALNVWILRLNGQDQIVRSGNYCCSSIRVASIDENKNSHRKITMTHRPIQTNKNNATLKNEANSLIDRIVKELWILKRTNMNFFLFFLLLCIFFFSFFSFGYFFFFFCKTLIPKQLFSAVMKFFKKIRHKIIQRQLSCQIF